jgi:hypothetical protein
MNQTVTQNTTPENNIIRTMVRGAYDLQKLRIQMGNRVAGNFRAKLGMNPAGMSEDELEKEEKKILDRLRDSYRRITDGIVTESGAVDGKFPTAKNFKGDELISSWTELVLVDQYMVLLRDEEKHFDRLGKVLTGIPIYDNFLSKVRGCGTAMAGVILSEINIHRAEYPSSLWAYAGLDAVYVAEYTDASGKVKQIPAREVDMHYEETDKEFLAEGKYPVKIISVGRSRREVCLVDREYVNKDGEQATRRSITYNPFLKTKLVGVLGTSFLRSGGSVSVNGEKLGAAKRAALAKEHGWDGKGEAEDFLRSKGFTVEVERSEYAAAYYNYKARLENDPRHKDKSDGHRHAMALRYAVKRFLVDLYKEWRKLEGLPVATEYSEGKLGKVHKKAA